MSTQRLAIMLGAMNLALLILMVAERRGDATANTTAPVLRGHRFELVDDRGQVRSRFDVEPSGEVVLRLLDENGTIRVKLGADSKGSGLLLLDEATEPAIHLIARRTLRSDAPATTSITLTGKDGQQRVITP